MFDNEKEQEKSDDSLSHRKNELKEEKDNSQHVALKLGLQLRSAILHGVINVDMTILGTLIKNVHKRGKSLSLLMPVVQEYVNQLPL